MARRNRNSRRRKSREQWRRGIYVLPNLFTTASLFAGFFAMVEAIQGNFMMACLAILASLVFDGLDGKVARATKTVSRFGVEFDSLADLVAFGVAPAILVYMWGLQPLGRLGFLAAFLFVACGACAWPASTSRWKKWAPATSWACPSRPRPALSAP